jgi:2-dehydropantoate 2-reductase
MVVRPGTLEKFPAKLQLESPLLGSFTVAVNKATQVPPADVLWVAVKATQLDAALQSVPKPDVAGAIVPLLNGIDHVALLRERFGHNRVVPGTFAGETERVAPGHIVHRSPFALLNVASNGRDRLASAIENLQALGFTCKFMDDEATLLWGKLMFLAPFALTTSAADATIGQVLASPQWRAKLEAAVRETCAVARAEGAELDADRAIPVFGTMPAEMRSSMQKDVERGNTPELDAIGGAILRAGARHNIPVPVTSELMLAVEHRVRLLSIRA